MQFAQLFLRVLTSPYPAPSITSTNPDDREVTVVIAFSAYHASRGGATREPLDSALSTTSKDGTTHYHESCESASRMTQVI